MWYLTPPDTITTLTDRKALLNSMVLLVVSKMDVIRITLVDGVELARRDMYWTVEIVDGLVILIPHIIMDIIPYQCWDQR